MERITCLLPFRQGQRGPRLTQDHSLRGRNSHASLLSMHPPWIEPLSLHPKEAPFISLILFHHTTSYLASSKSGIEPLSGYKCNLSHVDGKIYCSGEKAWHSDCRCGEWRRILSAPVRGGNSFSCSDEASVRGGKNRILERQWLPVPLHTVSPSPQREGLRCFLKVPLGCPGFDDERTNQANNQQNDTDNQCN